MVWLSCSLRGRSTCFADGVMPIWTTIIARVMFSSCILWQYIFIVLMPTLGSSVKWEKIPRASHNSILCTQHDLKMFFKKINQGFLADLILQKQRWLPAILSYVWTHQERKRTSGRWGHRCGPPTRWGLSAWGDPRWACLRTDSWTPPAFGPTRPVSPGILCHGTATVVTYIHTYIQYM